MKRDCSDQLIGVVIEDLAIRLGRFNYKGYLLAEKQIKTPQPPVPGVVTVAICEAIEDIDPEHLALFVGVELPESVEIKGHVVRANAEFSGWDEVPLIDWLEPRLNRRVVLAINGSGQLGAGPIAFEQFTSFNAFAKA